MERQEITPFRLQVLMDVAARIVKMMVTGAWHLSFDEMDMVLVLIRQGMEESIRRNKEDGQIRQNSRGSAEQKGESYVFKDRRNEEDHEGQLKDVWPDRR